MSGQPVPDEHYSLTARTPAGTNRSLSPRVGSLLFRDNNLFLRKGVAGGQSVVAHANIDNDKDVDGDQDDDANEDDGGKGCW